jgi:hypothetical protein
VRLDATETRRTAVARRHPGDKEKLWGRRWRVKKGEAVALARKEGEAMARRV